jgi:hypothetical protein
VKKINSVFEHIGPNGPLSNIRAPSIHDLEYNDNTTKFDHSLSPLYYSLPPRTFNIKSPGSNLSEKFVYELELSYTNDQEFYFKNGMGILDQNPISESVLTEIRKCKGFLLLSTLFESWLEDNFLEHMHSYFIQKNIPLTQVIYLSNCINCKDVYNKFCTSRNIQQEIRMEYIGYYMQNLINDTRSSASMKRPYQVGYKTKTFLNFNRRWHDHRVIVLLELYKRNMLDNSFISFNDTNPDNSTHSIIGTMGYINSRYNIQLSDNQLKDLARKLPLILDTNNFFTFPMELSKETTMEFYDNSLINLVSETGFFTNIIHLTEKTMKPIMYKHPFIFIGPPGCLRALRNMGFKTFSHIWDETYDIIEDHNVRMQTVLDLIEHIDKMSAIEKLEISKAVADIVEYNFNLFVSMPNTGLANFVEMYGTE